MRWVRCLPQACCCRPFGAGRAAEEPAKPGPAQREVIPVSDMAKLKSMLGKTVVVQGIIKRVTASRSEHRRVSFTQGDFILYIRKQDFDSSPDWKLDDLVGREIFAGGEVKDYRGQLELVLTKPAQIADAPERIDSAYPRRREHRRAPRRRAASRPVQRSAGRPPLCANGWL